MILHIQTNNQFALTLREEKELFKLKLDLAYKDIYEHYKGEYIINPKIVSQTMETKDKVMNDDVTINEIYYNETENLSGGMTVQIGEI